MLTKQWVSGLSSVPHPYIYRYWDKRTWLAPCWRALGRLSASKKVILGHNWETGCGQKRGAAKAPRPGGASCW